MYLVLSAFTSSPISLVAATKASAFSFSLDIDTQKEKDTLKFLKSVTFSVYAGFGILFSFSCSIFFLVPSQQS